MSEVPQKQAEIVLPNDLRLELRIKNNILWEAIHQKFKTVSALCKSDERLKNKQGEVGGLLAFKQSPFLRDGTYRDVCDILSMVLEVPAEQLFPAHLYEQIKQSKRVVTIDSFSALSSTVRSEVRLLTSEEPPEDALVTEELQEGVATLLKRLTSREAIVIKRRFGLEKYREQTLEEIAEALNVCTQRIRQIEAKALMKMKHPVRNRHLEDFADVPNTERNASNLRKLLSAHAENVTMPESDQEEDDEDTEL